MFRQIFLFTAALLVLAAPPAVAETESTFEVDAYVALDAYQGLVEEHLAGTLRAIRTLAVTSEAQTGEWTAVKPLLDRLSDELTTDATVWFALPDGSYASTASGPSTETLSDRAYFPDLLAGDDVEGSLVVSKSTGHRSIIVATPVARDGKVVAMIGVSVEAKLVSALVTETANLPDNLTFYALDSHGQAAIHRNPELMFQFPSDLGDPSLKAATETILSQPRGRIGYRFQETDRVGVFNKSEATGWHFVLVQIED